MISYILPYSGQPSLEPIERLLVTTSAFRGRLSEKRDLILSFMNPQNELARKPKAALTVISLLSIGPVDVFTRAKEYGPRGDRESIAGNYQASETACRDNTKVSRLVRAKAPCYQGLAEAEQGLFHPSIYDFMLYFAHAS